MDTLTSAASLGKEIPQSFLQHPQVTPVGSPGGKRHSIHLLGDSQGNNTAHGENSTSYLEWFPCKNWQGWTIIFFSQGVLLIRNWSEVWPAALDEKPVRVVGPRTRGDDKHLQSWVLICSSIWPSYIYKVNREISPQQAFLWGGWHFLPAPLGTETQGTHCRCLGLLIATLPRLWGQEKWAHAKASNGMS